MLGNSLIAAKLAASQEGPSSIKFVSESQKEVNSYTFLSVFQVSNLLKKMFAVEL
jgi:hypothetical protein